LSGGGFGRFDCATFATRGASVPLQLYVKSAVVWWAQSLDHRVLGGWFMSRLKALLQHRLGIRSGRCNRIGIPQFFAKRPLNEFGGGGQTTVDKDGADYGFENVSEQSSFAAAAALFFATPKAHKITQAKFGRGFGQGWRTH
jgi:hypothetical protein